MPVLTLTAPSSVTTPRSEAFQIRASLFCEKLLIGGGCERFPGCFLIPYWSSFSCWAGAVLPRLSLYSPGFQKVCRVLSDVHATT